jgi:hypothetical protein
MEKILPVSHVLHQNETTAGWQDPKKIFSLKINSPYCTYITSQISLESFFVGFQGASDDNLSLIHVIHIYVSRLYPYQPVTLMLGHKTHFRIGRHENKECYFFLTLAK